MSVLATLDFSDGIWNFDVQPETPWPDLQIGFKYNGGQVARFDNLSFGFDVVVNNFSVLTKEYPPQGLEYVATDQTYLTNDRVNLAADDEVVLAVWAENGGQRYEGQTTFSVPRPEQPYPSWAWDGTNWQPPVPHPDGDGRYEWDEEEQAWVEVAE